MKWFGAGMAFLSLALGLGLVWCNLARTDLGYELRTMELDLEKKKALVVRLELEHDSLLAAHSLRVQAARMGLKPATAGRLRKLPAPE